MAAIEQTQSPLFALPAELRNRIYEQVAIQQYGNGQPNLLRTCRKIREEGLELFYTSHAFRAPARVHRMQSWDDTAYQKLLTRLGTERASLIQHVRFELSEKHGGMRTATVDVTVHAKNAKVTEAVYLEDNVAKESRDMLAAQKTRLNQQWAVHPNPSKVGLLRTIPSLVPREVKKEGDDGEEDQMSGHVGALLTNWGSPA